MLIQPLHHKYELKWTLTHHSILPYYTLLNCRWLFEDNGNPKCEHTQVMWWCPLCYWKIFFPQKWQKEGLARKRRKERRQLELKGSLTVMSTIGHHQLKIVCTHNQQTEMNDNNQDLDNLEDISSELFKYTFRVSVTDRRKFKILNWERLI